LLGIISLFVRCIFTLSITHTLVKIFLCQELKVKKIVKKKLSGIWAATSSSSTASVSAPTEDLLTLLSITADNINLLEEICADNVKSAGSSFEDIERNELVRNEALCKKQAAAYISSSGSDERAISFLQQLTRASILKNLAGGVGSSSSSILRGLLVIAGTAGFILKNSSNGTTLPESCVSQSKWAIKGATKILVKALKDVKGKERSGGKQQQQQQLAAKLKANAMTSLFPAALHAMFMLREGVQKFSEREGLITGVFTLMAECDGSARDLCESIDGEFEIMYRNVPRDVSKWLGTLERREGK
jgi:high-affinity Fe2+/Pb2+ permease